MKKNKEKIAAIDKDAEAIMDKLPVGTTASVMMWAMAPGPMAFKAVRDVSKDVTPQAVEKFMIEWGFNDLYLGRIPVGKMFTGIAKKGAKLGGFATLNRQAYEQSLEDLEDKAESKWYTPIERILLLQNPLKRGPGAQEESLARSKNLILEADQISDEEKAFLDYLKISGFENKYMSEVSAPYVEAKDELITGLIDIFEKEIEETAKISSAQTFKEFIEAINSSTIEKFKQINPQNILKDMNSEIESLLKDDETLEKFLKTSGKELIDFENKENELKEFIAQKIYEKEFTETRMMSVESIIDGVEEIKIEILSGMDEKDLEDLKVNAAGNQLYNVIKSGLERLDRAAASIMQAQQAAQKAVS